MPHFVSQVKKLLGYISGNYGLADLNLDAKLVLKSVFDKRVVITGS
jgi:hypothetical protein